MAPLRFIHSLRPINLLMTVYILLSVKYGLFGGEGYATPATHVSYAVYIFSVLSVMAFGYLVNDYFDVETDKINKPGKNIFENRPPLSGIGYMVTSTLVAVVLPYCGYVIGYVPYICVWINAAALVLLFVYAHKGKAGVLWGNLLIAFLGALLLLAAYMATGNGLLHFPSYRKLVFDYTLFSFLATLLREIVKDAEDVEGDTQSGIFTLAGKYGINASRYVAAAVNILLVTVLALTARNQYGSQELARAAAFAVLAVYGIFTLFILWFARDKAGFRRTSWALKIFMLLGITSMWL